MHLLLFNYQKYEAVKSNVIEVTNQFYDCHQTDKAPKKINIRSYMEEELNNIVGSGVIV